MAEKLDEQLTITWSGKIMDVVTTDGTINTSTKGETFSNVQNILDGEIRFVCTVSDNYEIDTVTNTNEYFVVRCITSDSFIYTWADPTYRTDIIDTITIKTRAIGTEPSVIGPNTNLNITTLANTKWEFTLYPTYNIELLWDCLPSYPEYGYSIYAINTKWNNDTNGGLYFYTGRPDVYDDLYLYKTNTRTWYGPRTIEIIDGDHITEPAVIEFFKSQATLLSGGPLGEGSGDAGDSGEGGDESEGGDTPSTPTIGPNAQLTEFLTGIADAIREKTGTSDPINPQDFATTIAEMQTGSDVESNPDEMLKAMVEGTMLTFNVSTVSTVGNNAFANSFLIDVNLPACTSIGYGAFSSCSNLIRFSAPACRFISDYAFNSCVNLNIINLLNVSRIGVGAFSNCSGLQICSFPACQSIGNNAFASTNISKISLPICSSMGTQAFYYCTNLRSVSSADIPMMSYLSYTFNNCNNLSYVSLPNITSTYQAFNNCTALTTAYIPYCSIIGYSTFGNCYSLKSIQADSCLSIDYYAFSRCSALESVNFPKCSYIGGYAFYQCSKLSTVSLPVCSSIYQSAFYYCTALSKLYLMSTSIVSIYNSQVFSYTPITSSSYLGYFGSIYVPNSLLTSYKTATNWSYLSSRFVGV